MKRVLSILIVFLSFGISYSYAQNSTPKQHDQKKDAEQDVQHVMPEEKNAEVDTMSIPMDSMKVIEKGGDYSKSTDFTNKEKNQAKEKQRQVPVDSARKE